MQFPLHKACAFAGKMAAKAMEIEDETRHFRKRKCKQIYLDCHRTLISRDKRLAICACGSRLIVYSIKTGKILRALEEDNSNIVDFYLRKNSLQVISAYENGLIVLWDFTDGSAVRSWSLNFAIRGLLNHPTDEDIVFVCKKEKKEKSGAYSSKLSLLKVHLNSNNKQHTENGNLHHEKICSVVGSSKKIVLSHDANFVANVKKKKLRICSIKDKKIHSLQGNTSDFTIIASHPSKLMFATGNAAGNITLWRNFTESQIPVTTKVHWHCHPVNDLSFTHDGLYLLSGSLESVLVTWQLSSLSKDYMPRIGAPIKHISVSEDDVLAAITLSNNSVKIVSLAEKHLTCALQALSEVSTADSCIKQDPRTESLVVPVVPNGHLQFYDAKRDTVLSTMDVVGQDYVMGPKEDVAYCSVIDHFDFSYDGKWLATVERGNFKFVPEELKLKFWCYSPEERRYDLMTIADPPHDGPVISLTMRPRPESSRYDQMAVTTSTDGKFKLWTMDYDENSFDYVRPWKCNSAFTYGNSSCGKAAFSEDGSLLAVIYDKVVTIWDSEVGVLRTRFYCPVQNESFSDVIFGAGSSSPSVLARTSNYLLCWSILSCSLLWNVQSKVTSFAVDPMSGYFAISTLLPNKKSIVYMLDSSTSKTVLNLGKIPSKVKSMVFSTEDHIAFKVENSDVVSSTLYTFNDKKDIHCFGPLEERNSDKNHTEELTVEKVESEFEKFFGSIKQERGDGEKDSRLPENVPSGNPSTAVIRKIISTPSHVLPSVTSLCSTFFNAVVISTGKNDVEEEDEEDQIDEKDNDSEENDADDEPMGQGISHPVVQDETLTPQKVKRNPQSFKVNKHCDFNWLSQFVTDSYNE